MTGKKGQKVSKEKIYHIKTSNTLFQIEMWVLSSNAAEFKDQDRFSSQLNYLWNTDWILLCTQAQLSTKILTAYYLLFLCMYLLENEKGVF